MACLVLLWLSFCFHTEQLNVIMDKKEGLSTEISSQDKGA